MLCYVVHLRLFTVANSVVFVRGELQEDTMDLNDFLEEAAIMKEMKHTNLVQLLGKAHILLRRLPHDVHIQPVTSLLICPRRHRLHCVLSWTP